MRCRTRTERTAARDAVEIGAVGRRADVNLEALLKVMGAGSANSTMLQLGALILLTRGVAAATSAATGTGVIAGNSGRINPASSSRRPQASFSSRSMTRYSYGGSRSASRRTISMATRFRRRTSR